MQLNNKTYEDVFSTDHPKSRIKLNLNEISTVGMELDEYTSLFKNFLTEFYREQFIGCVRLSWLRRKFTYYGLKTKLPMGNNSIFLNLAFVKYLRRFIGKDIQILTRGPFFSKLELYFDELFPGFEDGNPFTNSEYYKFPFENITLEYLLVVHQLDDRIPLLREADKQKMTFAVFLDFVINHVLVENDKLGRERYKMRLNTDRNAVFHIKDTDKKLSTKRKRRNL